VFEVFSADFVQYGTYGVQQLIGALLIFAQLAVLQTRVDGGMGHIVTHY